MTRGSELAETDRSTAPDGDGHAVGHGPGIGPEAPGTSTARQVRGSSLLLAGRLFALGLDFVTQVLIVRYLLKEDYGALAFALSVVSLGSSAAVFGLDKTIPRFAPIYDERGERGLLVGSILMAVAAIAGIGAALIALVFVFQATISGGIVDGRVATDLLLILILLAPVQALDSLLTGLFAVFAKPMAILVRRYVVAPTLQLGAVLVVMLAGASVEALAVGLLLAAASALAVYGLVFARLVVRQGYVRGLRRSDLRFPVREVFGFSVPLMSSDVVVVLRTSLVVILLGSLASSADVADYRAAVPIARQNLLVLTTFSVLFLPIASRLYARTDHAGVSDLYWQTAAWIATMTFPAFIVSISLAEAVTVVLYGDRYASSGPILALLALGNYVSAALGFNALTLRVYARVRHIVTVDVLTALGMALALVPLISTFGALGGAVATLGALLAQNGLYQLGLARRTPVRILDPDRLRAYAPILGATAVVVLVQVVARPPVEVGVVLAAAASVAVLAFNRRMLRIGETFPELLRLPLARRLFA